MVGRSLSGALGTDARRQELFPPRRPGAPRRWPGESTARVGSRPPSPSSASGSDSRRDVGRVEQGLELLLPPPDPATGVGGVPQDGADRGKCPPAPVAVPIAYRVMGRWRRDSLRASNASAPNARLAGPTPRSPPAWIACVDCGNRVDHVIRDNSVSAGCPCTHRATPHQRLSSLIGEPWGVEFRCD